AAGYRCWWCCCRRRTGRSRRPATCRGSGAARGGMSPRSCGGAIRDTSGRKTRRRRSPPAAPSRAAPDVLLRLPVEARTGGKGGKDTDGVSRVAGAQLQQSTGAEGVDGAAADVEGDGDLLGGQAEGEIGQHRHLAGAEAEESLLRPPLVLETGEADMGH